MKIAYQILLPLVIALCQLSCDKPLMQRISEREAALQKGDKSVSLLELAKMYGEAAQVSKDSCRVALNWYTKAATLMLDSARKAPEASKYLLTALQNPCPEASKTTQIGQLARCYQLLRTKKGLSEPDDSYTTQIKQLVLAHKPDLLAALQAERDRMVDQDQRLVNPDAINVLTEIIEGYTLALDTSDLVTSAHMLFEAGNAQRALGNFGRAILFYDQAAAIKSVPEKAASSLFMKAFVFENDMQAIPQAKTAYEEFLKQFPHHEMANDARIALKNLGKSPEELLRSIVK